VDRIGQPKTVQALNFVFEDSVEFRVREVLEQKLSVIFHEFGIDKTGDVLDSAQAGELFENVCSVPVKPSASPMHCCSTLKTTEYEDWLSTFPRWLLVSHCPV